MIDRPPAPAPASAASAGALGIEVGSTGPVALSKAALSSFISGASVLYWAAPSFSPPAAGEAPSELAVIEACDSIAVSLVSSLAVLALSCILCSTSAPGILSGILNIAIPNRTAAAIAPMPVRVAIEVPLEGLPRELSRENGTTTGSSDLTALCSRLLRSNSAS